MKLADLLPPTGFLQQAKSIEETLLRRRRRGTLGLAVAVAGVVVVLVQVLLMQDELRSWVSEMVAQGRWVTAPPEAFDALVVVALTAIGLGAWLVLRFTDLLLGELREPFRYTFWIESFELVPETPGERFTLLAGDRFRLLHHDLRERLDRRIGRFSLLDETAKGVEPAALSSHIHISGYYALREDPNGRWALQVMPRIRIGGPGSPATLADPVFYVVLETESGAAAAEAPLAGAHEVELEAEKYHQIVERVYSRLATEVYKQIETDVEQKIRLFPTSYLRTVALFHEAEDFARSNTIDAYDRALELYRKALRYFEVAQFRRLSRWVVNVPLLWQREARFQHMEARVRLGYAKCLIYRRQLSALTGRSTNPLFEIRASLATVRASLDRLQTRIVGRPVEVEVGDGGPARGRLDSLLAFLTFPPDSLLRRLALRPSEALYRMQRQIRFEAFAVSALTLAELGANRQAADHLQDAKAVDPPSSEKSPLYLLAAGVIEPRLAQKVLRFRQATEATNDFQIAHYLLAYAIEMGFRIQNRIQNELTDAKAKPVVEEYDRVLRINPGNIAALAAQGHLLWLVGRLAEAKKRFEEGCEVNAAVQGTFVGELTYGQARIAAEDGLFPESHALYMQAIAAGPGIGAYSTGGSYMQVSYYEYITPSMLQRYRRFAHIVGRHRREKKGKASDRVLAAVYSYVLNDYGNACLNYFIRNGDRLSLRLSCKLFDLALRHDPRNAVARYNRYEARRWRGDTLQEPKELKEVVEALPGWREPLVSLAQSLSHLQNRARELQQKLKQKSDKLQRYKEDLEKLDQQQSRTRQLEEEVRRRRGHEAAVPIEEQRSPAPAIVRVGGRGHSLEDRIGKKQAEVKDFQEEVNRLQGEISDVETQRLEFGVEAIRGIFDNTKLSALFDVLRSQGVHRLLADRRIRWERLDDNDVAALRALAHVLPYLAGEETDRVRKLHEARDLLYHILHTYYPDSFEASHTLEAILQQLRQLPESFGVRPSEAESEQSREAIRAAVAVWLQADPTHFNALGWHRDYVPAVEHRPLLKRSVGSPAADARYVRSLLLDYRKEAERLFDLGDFDRARTAYETLDKIDPGGIEKKRGLARIHNALGNLKFESGEYRAAILEYEAAIENNPDVAVYHGNLAGALERLRETGNAEGLDEAAAALRRARELEPRPEYADQLIGVEAMKAVAEHYGEKALDLWPVTPIVVEVASDLIPEVKGRDGRLDEAMQERVNRLREKVRETAGVQIPGIRFRGNEGDMAPSTYLIMINEVPLVLATLPEGKLLCRQDVASLKELGIAAAAVEDPLTGDELAWVDSADCERADLPANAFATRMDFMIDHVEALVRQNLAEYLGHQEVANLLADAEESEEFESSTDHAALRHDPRSLGALTTVLRALVNQDVSVKDLARILEIFQEEWPAQKAVAPVVERIRAELCEELPGNSERYRFYELGPALEKRLRAALYRNGSEPILAMAPEECQETLSAIRDRLGDDHRAALVTASELRPHLWELVQLEWPRVPVLSREEWLPHLEERLAGRIDTEPQT